MNQKRRKALVIIDMQNGFMNQYTEHLRKKIHQFAVLCLDDFDAIITTKYINHEHTACYVFENWKQCMIGTKEAELIPEVESVPHFNIDKDKYSCYNTDFKNLISGLKIDDIYLCGVNTGCCVLHSAFDMYNDLRSVYVLEDLCGTTSGPSSHAAAVQVLRECITKDRVIQSSSIAGPTLGDIFNELNFIVGKFYSQTTPGNLTIGDFLKIASEEYHNKEDK